MDYKKNAFDGRRFIDKFGTPTDTSAETLVPETVKANN
jgi:hypothetical protein